MWQLEHRFKAGDRWEDTDRIFTKADGTAIYPDSVTEYFRLFIAKTNFPQISIHSLRHTNITHQIAAGVPLRTVSYRAGHAVVGSNAASATTKTPDFMRNQVFFITFCYVFCLCILPLTLI
jgi:site-specific recombinase XerD